MKRKSMESSIHHLRLEDFKRRRRDARYRGISTASLSEMCGFKKTTFFAAFKKFENCTPIEWIRGNG